MKVAVAQITCELGDIDANMGKVESWTQRAANEGCDLVVFPEMTDTGYEIATITRLAQPWPGSEAFQRVQAAAKANRINIVCGLSRRGTGHDGLDRDGIYNCAAAFNRDGMLLDSYAKTHLFSVAPVFEHRALAFGNELSTFNIEGVKCSSLICYDLRFPEAARKLALLGSQILIIPSAWLTARSGHWTTLLAARAIENQVFVIACNRIGTDGGVSFCGNSQILAPDGSILSAADSVEVRPIIADIDLKDIAAVRSRMNLFLDRRPELYGIEIEKKYE